MTEVSAVQWDSVGSASISDSEPVYAAGRRQLWEAKDGVGAPGAARQEVGQLVPVADAHPCLLHLHQHDPLHPNLPQAQMMSRLRPDAT